MPRFEVDAGASVVRIEARSSLHPIVVEARGLCGFVDVELAGGGVTHERAAGRLEVPVAQLRSGNALLDRETERRVDVRRHPTIVAELTGLGAGVRGRHPARGTVTFRGVRRAAEGELTIDVGDGGRTLHILGERMFDVRDFGLTPPRLLLFTVHPDVRVRLELRARTRAQR